ncbi:GNAT family N-acetyltransferase [Massilia sp. PAMC28688]|uniref:GNAT family N-acetyltransferase n=1 Tax=Massilia sp. PAMC28688 TaxID=2861283 RepID=UPI001C62F0B7|nr:GNAT family N-acetyltransferase [Massilia sp. PAMC28688]QYF95575.1 GNAT family N-acetyltransferase [Massilia sp. PAMC28688]
MPPSGCTVRPAAACDSPALLALMRELAVFEGYSAQFRVTEQDLLARGLQADGSPQFAALVAQAGNGPLLGYAVTCLLPFTFDLRPSLVLKELYVLAQARGQGIGQALMAGVLAQAHQHGCGRIKWDVLPHNHAAKAFYRAFGARQDTAWEGWIRHLP